MLRFCLPLVLFLTVIQPAPADNGYWREVTETISLESGLSDLGIYDEGMEFFYFPSFRPVELFRIVRVTDKWYALHSVFRKVSHATLFDTSERRGHFEVQTRVVSLGKAQLELILRQLKENSFELFNGDENEMTGFDDETFYFQFLRNREKISFHYWNAGSSVKSQQMNAIAKVFKDIDYENP